MTREIDIMRAMMVAAPSMKARLWRNNVGSGLMIRGVSPQAREAIIAECQRVAAKLGGSASRITFGLPTGSGDLIGYVEQRISPEHVGCVIPRFASVEVKSATGRASDEQKQWHSFMVSVGAVSGVSRTVGELSALLEEKIPH